MSSSQVLPEMGSVPSGSVGSPDIWLADLTYTQQSISAESMPYSVACLGAYLTKQVPDVAVRLFKYPEKLITALETAADPPKVVGLTHYVWNARLSLTIARAIKSKWPGTTIVLGGPHYSLDVAERLAFLRENVEIDYYVSGEGEQAFTDLIVALRRSFDEMILPIPGVHTARSDPSHVALVRPRMREMAPLPIYESGMLDEFFDGQLVPIIQTNRGCPFTCSFCVEGESYYSKVASHDAQYIRSELEYIAKIMGPLVQKGGRNELIITDSNFGMYAQDIVICEGIRDLQEQYGWPRYINATTGKNRRERVLEAIQKTAGAIQLTGSVQSLDPDVLTNIRRRNIDASALLGQALQAAEAGATSYSEVILAPVFQ